MLPIRTKVPLAVLAGNIRSLNIPGTRWVKAHVPEVLQMAEVTETWRLLFMERKVVEDFTGMGNASMTALDAALAAHSLSVGMYVEYASQIGGLSVRDIFAPLPFMDVLVAHATVHVYEAFDGNIPACDWFHNRGATTVLQASMLVCFVKNRPQFALTALHDYFTANGASGWETITNEDALRLGELELT